MKFKTAYFVLICISLLTNDMKAQFWKKLKNKTIEKVEQKIDNETDKALESVINSKTNKALKVNNDYTFLGSVTVEVSSDQEKASFNILFNNDKDIFCMHMNAGDGQDVYNVISPQQSVMFMNASGMKIKKVIPSDQFANLDYTDKVPSKHDLQKTGNTKTILGYLCEEYKYENDGGVVSAWVTKNFPIKSNYAPMLGMTRDKSLGGFTLELDYKTNNGEKANVKVIKINKSKKITINTSEYKSM